MSSEPDDETVGGTVKPGLGTKNGLDATDPPGGLQTTEGRGCQLTGSIEEALKDGYKHVQCLIERLPCRRPNHQATCLQFIKSRSHVFSELSLI